MRLAFEEWLQAGDSILNYICWVQRQADKIVKMIADWWWSELLGNDFYGNKNVFFKEVQHVNKGEQILNLKGEDVKDVKVKYCDDVRKRWVECFEKVLYVEDDREQMQM